MTLLEMLSQLPNPPQQSNTLAYIIHTRIPLEMVQYLIYHRIDPDAFTTGINFILQHIQIQGLPEDWEAVLHPVDPDPAKNNQEALTTEDGAALAEETAQFFAKKMGGFSMDNLEGSGF